MSRARWLTPAVGAALVAATLIVAVAVPGLTTRSGADQKRLVVAAGTTLVDSGFMHHLAAAYENVDPETQLSIVGLSSAEAIAHASAGNADVIITHNRDMLDAYLEKNPSALRIDAFTSAFFLVAGPTIDLPAGSLGDALGVVVAGGHPFVSRDDGSGTHAAELAAWEMVGIDPAGEPWYIRTGTGMGATLLVTDQRHAVTLAEHGSFLAVQPALALIVVAGTAFPNPYDLTVIDPSGAPAALAFSDWLASPEGHAAIVEANEYLFGEQVYAAP